MKRYLSIIIPVYNVAEHLNKCVDSVVNQTYKDLEILLVDDGSTDNSGKMCDEWAKKDSRIKVFHKKNGGLSDARNFGIEKATGEYVGFVDSDDWIAKDMYEKLVSGCKKFKADIGCCNKVRVHSKGIKLENYITKEDFLNREDALLLLLSSLDPSVCNKIIRRKLFSKVKFPLRKLYEDIITTPYLIDQSNGMYLNNCHSYYYNQQNEASITHAKFDPRKMDYMKNAQKVVEHFVKKYPALKEAADSFYILSLTALLTDICKDRKQHQDDFKTVMKELKKSKGSYWKNKYIPTKKKIMIWLDLHHMRVVVDYVKHLKNNI